MVYKECVCKVELNTTIMKTVSRILIAGCMLVYCYGQLSNTDCDPAKYQVYDRCASCPRICSNGTFQQIYCIWCVEGCGCKPGYVLQDDICIKEEECCKKPNQTFQPNGPYCPDMCTREGIIVSLPCGNGNKDCFCNPGYVFNQYRECILKKKCKPYL